MDKNGFTRVERDDRLLDVFTNQTPEKGVQLWEKWNKDTVEIIRIHNKKESHRVFSRKDIEDALQKNTQLDYLSGT